MGKQQRILSRYRSVARKWQKEGRVLSVEFSGPTYQVEVNDPAYKEALWPFLQFDTKGEVKDLFCPCDEGDDEGGCPHLAAALLKIYGNGNTPLHTRFERSFWDALCQFLANHIGYEHTLMEREQEGSYKAGSLMVLKGKSARLKKELSALFTARPKETEETSLKFSNLPQDEITHWREGRASESLLYKLSFWSDLARLLFLWEDQNLPYTLRFKEGKSGFPQKLFISFKELSMECDLNEAFLLKLIPTLNTVNSPLFVSKNGGEKVDHITYDAKKKQFHIIKMEQKTPHEKGKLIGGWEYISQKGFYQQKEKSIFDHEVISQNQLESFLTEYGDEIRPLLKGVALHDKSAQLNYQIRFDPKWNLHFTAYLFEPGDITDLFGAFAYVQEKGFYPVHSSLFPTQSKKINAWHVSEFVGENRVWFNAQEGFATHLLPIEAPLTYGFKEGVLFFESGFAKKGNAKDFGDWIYIKKEGFFAKKQVRAHSAIVPGLEIASSEIPPFIKENRDDLLAFPNFFLSTSPIAKRKLQITLSKNDTIKITPEIETHPQYKGKKITFFEDVVFVEGEGFFELPQSLHLPSRFCSEVTLEKDVIPYFLRFELEGLKSVISSLDPRLKKPKKLDFQLQYLAKDPQGGVKAQFHYLTDSGGEIPLSKIKGALVAGEAFLFDKGGLIDLEDERLAWLNRIDTLDPETNTVHLSTLEFLKLEASHTLLAPTKDDPLAQMTRTLLKELREFSSIEPFDLKGLKSELRPYQQAGLSWLWFLYRNNLAGLLCDEMGLGKTHQALALIAAVRNKDPASGRILVVCPTSVIYHWEDKFARFLPQIKVHTFHGIRRSLKNLPKKGVLLTTFGIVRQEQEALQKLHFELAILDEIQAAKNRHSRVHRALVKMNAKMRLGLTGTPIENNLLELKALFDVVLPTFMPSESKYKELFVTPIEKQGNEEKKEQLKALIHPFMLRRKKRDVLEELPDKIEEKAYTDLSDEQALLYKQTLSQSRKKILTELENETTPIPYIHIFALLMQLKQICNHPALIAKDPKNYKKYQSGKWDLFVELMEEIDESEQKVVVFSQYLFMLDIIEHYVKEKRWGYAQIRGGTQDRKKEIIRFQEDPNCRVFIGSLGAAGVGIDLTAASTVILYDRWWNPARENQAIDRVHRIGQKWGVQVFKLITKGTIEERIDQLVEKKHKLMEEVISTDDQDAIKTLSRGDLISLLTLENEKK